MFLAPAWLALLLPWAGLVAWLWRRTADERATTAAFLWDRETPDAAQRRTVRRHPPAWILCVLFSMSFAIVALANPSRAGSSVRVTVIVDGSVELAATRAQLIERANGAFSRANDLGIRTQTVVRIVGVGEEFADLAAVEHAGFTARRIAGELPSAIDDACRSADVVVVLTGEHVERVDPRVIVIAPTSAVDNVGIVSAVATDSPKPSLVVRVLNDSDRAEATMKIQSGDWSTSRHFKLPSRGGSVNTFFDLPSPADVIDVSLVDLHDAMPIDDSATIRATSGWPTLLVDAGVPPVASRFAAAYEHARGSSQNESRFIAIESTPAAKAATPELVLATKIDQAVTGPTRAESHLGLLNINLDQPAITRISAKPPGDWRPIAWVGDSPIVCVRDTSPRGVWIGFELDPNELRSVVLLNNAVEWLADAGPREWQGESPDSVGRDWKPIDVKFQNVDASPGTYLDAAGRTVSVNVPARRSSADESRGDLGQQLQSVAQSARLSLRVPVSVCVGVLSLAAAILERRRAPRRPQS